LHGEAGKNSARDLLAVLREFPDVDVNWRHENQAMAALHVACRDGASESVGVLLAHPKISVNQKDSSGQTPICWSSIYGRLGCVRRLLRDSRVLLNEPDIWGNIPLKQAAQYGHIDTVRWYVASGRKLSLGHPGNSGTDVLGEARRSAHSKPEVVALIDEFKRRPAEARHRVRVEIGWYREQAADLFALVVFLCEGLLRVLGEEGEDRERQRLEAEDARERRDKIITLVADSDAERMTEEEIDILFDMDDEQRAEWRQRRRAEARAARDRTKRFFKIAASLPMELQMVLCHRAVGSVDKGNINTAECEVAFKDLVPRFPVRASLVV